MNDEIRMAIVTLVTKAERADAGDALKFTQSALNLAHTMATYSETQMRLSDHSAKATAKQPES